MYVQHIGVWMNRIFCSRRSSQDWSERLAWNRNRDFSILVMRTWSWAAQATIWEWKTCYIPYTTAA